MFNRVVVICLLIISVYCLGFSHCKQNKLSQKVEVINYVKSKEIKILSMPNADKSDLLKLMYINKL